MQLLVFMKRPEYQDVMINTPLSGSTAIFMASVSCIIVNISKKTTFNELRVNAAAGY